MLTKQFGKRLAYLRATRNLTQVELAGQLDVTVQHYGRLERGESGPSFKIIAQMCAVFGLQPAELFKFNEHEEAMERQEADGNPSVEPVFPLMGTLLVYAGTDRVVCSESLGTLFGYGEGALQDPWRTLAKHLSTDDMARLQRHCHHALCGGRTDDVVLRVRRRDKVRRSVNVRCEHVYDAMGMLQGVQLVFHESVASSHAAADEAVFEEKGTVESGDLADEHDAPAVQQHPEDLSLKEGEGYWEWNFADRTIEVSSKVALMLGYEADDGSLTGTDLQQWADRVAPEDIHRLTRLFNDIFRGMRMRQFAVEVRLRRRDGEFGSFALRGICFRDTSGAIERITGTLKPLGILATGYPSSDGGQEVLKFLLPELIKPRETISA